MSPWRRLRNVLWKEWRGLAASTSTILMVTLVPLLLVGQILLVIFLVTRFVAPETLTGSMLGNALAQLVAAQPEIGQLPLAQQFQVYFYQQLPLYLLLIPMMIANMISTFSIVEEKQTRTLEPLLATPVRTGELLLGKAMAGALPAIGMTWISAGLVLLGISLIGPAPLLRYTLTPSWLISALLLTPLATLLSFLLGVIGSRQASDPREAQGWALIEIFPFLGLVAVQVLGILPLTPLALLSVAAGFALIDLFFLRLSVFLFRRESILVRWR
jgi:ABC-2 type transport system permease protein